MNANGRRKASHSDAGDPTRNIQDGFNQAMQEIGPSPSRVWYQGSPTDRTISKLTANEESELQVLSCLILHPDMLDQVRGFLSSDDFTFNENGLVYQTMLVMWDRGDVFDAETLGQELFNDGALDRIGGAAYLSHLVTMCPNPMNLEYHSGNIREASNRRKMLYFAEGIKNDARFGFGKSITDMVSEIEKKLEWFADHSVSDVPQASQVAQAVLQNVTNPPERKTSSLGYDALDRICDVRGGELVIVGARPGIGKTSFLLSVMNRMAMQDDVRTLFFSLEMGQEELMERLYCLHTGIDLKEIRNPPEGGFVGGNLAMMESACDSISQMSLGICDEAPVTIAQISAVAGLHKRRVGLDLICVDYLGLLTPEDSRAPREQQVSGMSRDLKILARKLDVPIMCAHQLNRQVTGRTDFRPRLSDLKDSGGIEANADKVLLLYRAIHEAGNPGVEGEVIVAKNRTGPIGTALLDYRGRTTEWMDRGSISDNERYGWMGGDSGRSDSDSRFEADDFDDF